MATCAIFGSLQIKINKVSNQIGLTMRWCSEESHNGQFLVGTPPNVTEQDSTAATQLTDTQAVRTSARSDIHRGDPRLGNPGASVEAEVSFGEAVEVSTEMFKASATTSRAGLTPGSGVVAIGESEFIDCWLDTVINRKIGQLRNKATLITFYYHREPWLPNSAHCTRATGIEQVFMNRYCSHLHREQIALLHHKRDRAERRPEVTRKIWEPI